MWPSELDEEEEAEEVGQEEQVVGEVEEELQPPP